jgi:hypothetical protein
VHTQQLMRTIEIKDRTGRVIGTKEVVTYQGLLSKAHEDGLVRVRTKLLQVPDDANGRTAITKAVIETAKGRFEAIGDASPENVNSFITPHLIRMAETRAKARALRDAVNIGVVSFEELDGDGDEARGSGLGSGGPADRDDPQASDARNGDRMTDAQRRYLFRILAGRGIRGEAAHERLKDLLGVESLTEAAKREASALIEELLATGGETADAPPQR